MIFWRSNCKTLGCVLCTLLFTRDSIHYQLLAVGAAFFSHNLVASFLLIQPLAEFSVVHVNSAIIRISAENKGVETARGSTRALAPAMLKPRRQMHLFAIRNNTPSLSAFYIAGLQESSPEEAKMHQNSWRPGVSPLALNILWFRPRPHKGVNPLLG